MPHFESLDGVDVVAVADSNSEVLDGFTRDFPVRGYRDWRDMLEKEKLDIAVIFLPHVECPEAAEACAKRGIHLIVEKPMAASASGVQRMISAAKDAGVLLTAPYLWRYHPVSRSMKRLVDEDTLGRVVGCEGRCAAGRLSRYIEGNAEWMLTKALSGGGPMYNLGVHWIDLYRWILRDEVVEVVAKNVKVSEEYDIEDNSFALLTFSKGAVVMLDISYTVPDSYPYGRDLSLSLRGTRGVLSWSPSFEGTVETLFVCSDAEDYSSSPRRHLEFELAASPGYCGILGLEFLSDFCKCVRTRSEPSITGDDGLRALEVVEAIYQSAEAGRAVRLGQR
jgi:predicted dehydrogenase